MWKDINKKAEKDWTSTDPSVVEADQEKLPAKVLGKGKALKKVGTEYTTAIAVQKPRDIDKIIADAKKECQFGGQKFYYAWTFKEGKSAGKKVEGGSIGLATALARIWGNVAIPVTVEETEDSWLFTATFIDLETGFNIQRIYRFDRTADVYGRYSDARKEDMKFQIAQSKAIRNVILNGGVPKWLVEGAITLSKKYVSEGINKEGIAKATKRIVESFELIGLKEKQLVEYTGMAKADWTSETIATLEGVKQSIEDEQITVNEIIQSIETSKKENNGISVADVINGKEDK